ncbi:hypothetical protein A3K34_00535 [candidate division WWE3 bacterium RIFOXYC1_FULL_40_10]|uniref:Adenylate kinase n=1 Tax=candidate division WWE3 bacterium RIFOXYA2_FULL_46_9 TaxID=1802636 RepID=A0A1F4W3K0_UNCKA|nr:MAG: hypothetical protein A3K58_00535 [candidate division WWE3 bacterium RIFOXYB1_FULL_40_22]OGC61370.1 MAG: hypothetical protein A3K37_00535 [candidate division WWE3 bacterium RIFOXYA1_FULL_40_11]OGC63930.1 MAG: hypothetical protein A2264_02495 [candidate division WWE3 bacterium RIFOXYA2_FULL_46_9]OGC65360.1 MAG: hypothetical protein A2326_04820 [candidate division WWE3 bacterium RIFOXYB2_FULL_41_6]OGC65753.1 MAG: hypothetical protein A3K34_00535 [candidate division WWE3 bacterium RIFOXYC1_
MTSNYYNSKVLSTGKSYDLSNPSDRHSYWHDKAGKKIEELKEFLEHNSFMAFLVAKKQAGKGTYAKMIEELLGQERFTHISVGDVVRKVEKDLKNAYKAKEITDYLKREYRGFISIEDALTELRNRTSDKVSVPTELVLTLLKKEIKSSGNKGIFLDGLPRTMDQVSYSLYFRDLVGSRYEKDFFILIDVPLELIKIRMSGRRVCPQCGTSRSLVLNPTKFVRFSNARKDGDQFYFLCDNSGCAGYQTAEYIAKEGDDGGVELIEDRMRLDNELMSTVANLHGVPNILLNGCYPKDIISNYLEEYEIQTRYDYQYVNGSVKVTEAPLYFRDEKGQEVGVMRAAVFVLCLIDQMHSLLI